MKIAAFIATLVVRLLGVYLLFKSAAALVALTGAQVGVPVNDQLATVLVFQIGIGAVTVMAAGRIVRLFTADAPFGNE